MSAQILSPRMIIDCLKTGYGISVAKLRLLPLGADIEAAVYKAETSSGQSYFVKAKKGVHDETSLVILTLLQASGINPIIPPLKTIAGDLQLNKEGVTFIVFRFVEGTNGFSCHLKDDQWIVLGQAMRQVHEFDLPPSIRDHVRKETYSPTWRNAVRSLEVHIDENPAVDEIALKFQMLMKKHQAVIHRLVNRAEFLSQKIRNEPGEFVLCHSDIHAGNVLIEKNGALCIVDWDELMMAPKERDLMFIGGGVANTWNDPDQEKLFYRGYGSAKINIRLLAYYRHERIIVDIAEYGQALLLNPEEGSDRQKMYEQFNDMFEPNGVVAIAFRTHGAK